MTEEQKVQAALKKAKLERAKIAVSKSFDRSLGGLKRNKRKRKQAHSESFVLRRAAALEQKNRDIVSALAKTRQQSSQLERVVIRYRENEMKLAIKLGSYQRKIREMSDKLNVLKAQLAEKDGLVSRLQKLFSAGLTEIVQSSDGCDSSSTVDAGSVSTHQPLRIPRGKPREAEDSSSSSSSDEEPRERESAGEHNSDKTRPRRATTRSRSTSPLSDLSALEECSDSSEEEQNSDADISNSERPLSSVATRSEGSLGNASKDVGENQATPSGSNYESRGRHEKPVAGNTDQTLTNIRLSISFSSDDGAKSSDSDEVNEPESDKAGADGISSTNDVTQASVSSLSIRDVEILNRNMETDCEHHAQCLSEQNHGRIIDTAPEKGKVKRASRGKAASKEKGNKNKNVKKKPPPVAEQKNIYDFLSYSSDSFVNDPDKTISLDSSRSSILAESLPENRGNRYSDPGAEYRAENEENMKPGRRSGRRRAAVSYVEPSLTKKLRRGHPMADRTLCDSFSPKGRKKSAGSKRVRSK